MEEQGWCDLSSEVSTFPEPSHLSLRPSQIPDPVGLSSSPEDPTAHTSTVPEPPVRGPCSHSMESSTHSPQTLSKTRRPSLHSWVEALPSPGFSSAGKEEGRKATGPVSRKLPTYWVKVSDRVPLQNEVEAKKEEEVQGCGKKDGRKRSRWRSRGKTAELSHVSPSVPCWVRTDWVFSFFIHISIGTFFLCALLLIFVNLFFNDSL